MTKKKSKSPFPEEIYQNIDLDSLVTYAVWSIEQKEEACTFERLVEECFTLFPKKFSLFGYPKWPDAARINKSWLRCRTDKGLISGKAKLGFKLTEKGQQLVNELLRNSGVSRSRNLVKKSSKRVDKARTPYDAVLRWIESTPYFSRYSESPKEFTMTEEEVRDFFQCVRETPERILRERLNLYKSATEYESRKDLKGIVLYCERAFPYLFKAKGGQRG